MMAGLVPPSADTAAGTSDEADPEALFARVLAQQIRSSLPDEALGGEWGDAFGPLLDEVLAVQLREKLAASRDPATWTHTARPARNAPAPTVPSHARPVPGPARVTSRYGHRVHPITGKKAMHHGLDLAAPRGTAIRAGKAGTVLRAERAGGYGLLVEVDHGDGVTTRYAHCDRLDVRPGQVIDAGELLGTVGSTGRSTGPHLHYEVRIEGRAADPQEQRWNDLFPQLGDGVGRKVTTDHPH